MAILHESKPIKALIGVEEYVSTDQIQVAEFIIPIGRSRHLYEDDVKSMSFRLYILLKRKFGRFFIGEIRPRYERNSKYVSYLFEFEHSARFYEIIYFNSRDIYIPFIKKLFKYGKDNIKSTLC